jgi:hypothetical protein
MLLLLTQQHYRIVMMAPAASMLSSCCIITDATLCRHQRISDRQRSSFTLVCREPSLEDLLVCLHRVGKHERRSCLVMCLAQQYTGTQNTHHPACGHHTHHRLTHCGVPCCAAAVL